MEMAPNIVEVLYISCAVALHNANDAEVQSTDMHNHLTPIVVVTLLIQCKVFFVHTHEQVFCYTAMRY